MPKITMGLLCLAIMATSAESEASSGEAYSGEASSGAAFFEEEAFAPPAAPPPVAVPLELAPPSSSSPPAATLPLAPPQSETLYNELSRPENQGLSSILSLLFDPECVAQMPPMEYTTLTTSATSQIQGALEEGEAVTLSIQHNWTTAPAAFVLEEYMADTIGAFTLDQSMAALLTYVAFAAVLNLGQVPDIRRKDQKHEEENMKFRLFMYFVWTGVHLFATISRTPTGPLISIRCMLMPARV